MDDIGVQPIEHITQSPGETELDVTIRRLDRERFWMLEVGTMYPYGLNDCLQHVENVSHSYVQSRNNAINGAMDGEVTPDATKHIGPTHWTNFTICTTEVRVMVAYIVFELLSIAPGYQIYINYLMNVNS